jgi:hypothetical protein
MYCRQDTFRLHQDYVYDWMYSFVQYMELIYCFVRAQTLKFSNVNKPITLVDCNIFIPCNDVG